MRRLAENVLELIGGTPLVAIRAMAAKSGAAVWAKMEQANPGGSVKDRICLAMIEDAERSGKLKPGGVVVEPTSGNTGIGLAIVCAVRGYRCVLAMPESMSLERRQLLEAYGVEVVLTPEDQQMEGAVAKAREIAQRTPGAFMPQQFDNPANPRVHAETTAREILDAMKPLRIDAFVVGVGTGGTVSGVGEVLRRELSPRPRIVAVEPELCATISRGQRGPTKIQGLGAGFVPRNYHAGVVDEEVAYGRGRRRVAHEGRPRAARGASRRHQRGGGRPRGAGCRARPGRGQERRDAFAGHRRALLQHGRVLSGGGPVTRGHARALVVGVGGIGCPAAVMLARAGVGIIGLCDEDSVDATNLHRQIFFSESDAEAGKAKVDAAAQVLRSASPLVDVRIHRFRLLPDNAVDLVRQYDVVLEGADNFATKFLAADACMLAGVPVVHASAVRWVATALAVGSRGAPCYRCLFEDAPRGGAEGCSEAGVMGPVVGVIAAAQVDLALTLLDSGGQEGEGELVTFDGRTEALRRRRIAARTDCALCGEPRRIRRITPQAYAPA